MKAWFLTLVSLFLFNANAFDAGKYFQQNCKSCHGIGTGDTIGPDLAGLSKRRSVDWIVKFIKYPDGMMNGDPDEAGYEKADPLAKKVYNAYKPTVMSEFPVTKVQVTEILKYIDSLKKEPKGKIVNIK